MKVYPSINFNNDFDGNTNGEGMRNCYKGSFIITYNRYTDSDIDVYNFPQWNPNEGSSTTRITTLNLHIVQSDNIASSSTHKTYYYNILISAYSGTNNICIDVLDEVSVSGTNPSNLIDWANSISYNETNNYFSLNLYPSTLGVDVKSVFKGFYILY
jgi:hypothetical protein